MQVADLNFHTVNYEPQERYPGNFTGYKKEGNYIEITTDNHTLMRVYVLENSMLRFRYSTIGQFDNDFSYAIDPDFRPKNPGFEFY